MKTVNRRYPLLILSAVVLLALGLAQSIIVSAFREPDPLVLTYAEVNPLNGTIAGEMASAFKEKAEEVSGGKLQIDIQAGGVLGNEEQILDNLLGGGNLADISRISASALTQYGCKKTSLLGIPYTFSGEEHFWKFADSDLAQELLHEPQEVGLPLQGLCFGEEGFRHFFFRKPVAGRYIPFIKSPSWAEEMVLTMMVYMAVLSASLVIRKGSHIRMTAFDKILSPKALEFSDLLSDLLVMGLGVVLLVYGIRLQGSPLCRLGHYSSMPGVSKFWQYLPIAIAGGSMILFEAEQFFIHLKKFCTPERKEGVEK